MKKREEVGERWGRRRLLGKFFGVVKGLVREGRRERGKEVLGRRTEAMTRQYNLASSFHDFTL